MSEEHIETPKEESSPDTHRDIASENKDSIIKDRDIDFEIQHRSIEVEPDFIKEEERRVDISVSSEAPVERSFGTEILSHSEDSIDLSFLGSGNAPLLLDHDMRQQIGIVEKVNIDDGERRLRATVRFGKNPQADEAFKDVADGIRKNISVGYRIDELNQSERENETVFVADRWTPLEVSLVAIGADQTVGVGRSAEIIQQQPTVPQEENTMEPQVEINVDEARAEAARDATQNYAKQVREILALGAKHNRRDLAEESISKNLSIEQFRGVLLQEIGDAKPLEVAEPDLTPREQKKAIL